MVVTFIMPETYASTARMAVKTDPLSACKVISSEVVLNPVINALKLNSVWGLKYNAGQPLKPTDTLTLLKSRLEVFPERNERVVDIRMFSEDKIEAAQIANAVADAYANQPFSLTNTAIASPRIEIVERATAGREPVRPNKVLNLTAGAAAGILLGAISGGIVAGLSSFSGRKSNRV
jgi:uncharacterized protein involved in exopolysaccharide biosynthesis